MSERGPRVVRLPVTCRRRHEMSDAKRPSAGQPAADAHSHSLEVDSESELEEGQLARLTDDSYHAVDALPPHRSRTPEESRSLGQEESSGDSSAEISELLRCDPTADETPVPASAAASTAPEATIAAPQTTNSILFPSHEPQLLLAAIPRQTRPEDMASQATALVSREFRRAVVATATRMAEEWGNEE